MGVGDGSTGEGVSSRRGHTIRNEVGCVGRGGKVNGASLGRLGAMGNPEGQAIRSSVREAEMDITRQV